MADLIKRKPVFELPLTKGDDLAVRFTYKVPVLDGGGQPVKGADGKVQYVPADYPDGASVQLEIDSRPQKVFTAAVEGQYATIRESFSDVDGIPKNLPWRVKVVYADGLNKVAAKGKTARDD